MYCIDVRGPDITITVSNTYLTRNKTTLFVQSTIIMDNDLDDTHLCIKCNATIVGLEFYVSHRRRNCVIKTDQPIAAVTKASPSGLSARPRSTDFDGPAFSYDNERTDVLKVAFSPTHHHHHHHHHHSEQLPSLVSLDSEHHGRDYDYDLGADIFFSSLELQSSNKMRNPPATLIAPSSNASTSAGGAGGVPTSSQGQTAKLMRAVRAISGNRKLDMAGYQMNIRLSQDSPLSFGHAACDVEDDAMDVEHDGDGDDDGDDDYVYDDDADSATSASDSDVDDADNDADAGSNADRDDGTDDGHSPDIPPPGYTKGKWIPGSKIMRLDYKSADVFRDPDKFHCRICDRQLCSRANYDKHLASDLHRKRSQPEHELDQALRDSLRIAPELVDTAAVVESEPVLAETPASLADGRDQPRRRRTFFIKCDVCHTRLARHMLGKHLISQYHYRRMGQLHKPYDQVFKYMADIVRHSPFQCRPCRFYAITAEHFMLHWLSAEHAAQIRDAAAVGSGALLWCSDCKFMSPSNATMADHLLGGQHQALVETIDRSVPIIIRQMQRIVCPRCAQCFQLNVQLRSHMNNDQCGTPETGGATVSAVAAAASSSSDRYQSIFRCPTCPVIAQSLRSLQHHQTKMHAHSAFFCSICQQTFATSAEAREHRSTAEHKVQSKRQRLSESGAELLRRKCRCCEATLSDVVQLKEHMRSMHPDDVYCCPTCGLAFGLQQELSRHVRDASCFGKGRGEGDAGHDVYADDDSDAVLQKCNQCDYRYV